MEKIPKMSGILQGNCSETCRNTPQKRPMNGFPKKNSLTRHRCFLGTPAATSYKKNKYLVKVHEALFCYNTYVFLGIAKDSSDCLW